MTGLLTQDDKLNVSLDLQIGEIKYINSYKQICILSTLLFKILN